MRNALLAATAVVLLAGCSQSADNPAANADAPSGQVLPIRDNAAVAGPHAEPRPQALKLMHDRHENMEKDRQGVQSRRPRAQGQRAEHGRRCARRPRPSPASRPRSRPGSRPAPGPDVGKTMAKPEIWQKPADFAAKAKAFQAAALAFNAAAKSRRSGRHQGQLRRPRQDLQGVPRQLSQRA